LVGGVVDSNVDVVPNGVIDAGGKSGVLWIASCLRGYGA